MKCDIFRAVDHVPAGLQHTAFWLGSLVLITGLGVGAMEASARQPAFDETREGIEMPVRESRRSELRRALINTHESGATAPVRRRLSDEERSALHRDLRDAMRGAYPETPRGRKNHR